MADLTPAATLRAAAERLRMDHKALREFAEPLAAWLDGVAKDIDGHDPDGGCECTESDSYHRAMDFAAAIIGGQS